MVETVSERVLVVATQRFHELGYFQGFTAQVERYVPALLDPEYLTYRLRTDVEQDPNWKQLIPYVIFLYRDPSCGPMLFQYLRGVGQGEGRLHHKRSIGIGGHISATDAANGSSDPFDEGMRREIEEEVIICSPYRLQCVGLINDDLTEVGRVHLGLVYLADLHQPAVQPREKDICQSGFLPLSELFQHFAEFETWSQLCLEGLFGQEAKP
ncbi:MAG: phosphoesterase [Thermoguttaceae bacterium]|nr:phosphoesterase [Thermoguttaceae bacterium]MDW8038296.1 phosphoesterase [Thermoguttaceae bacterium]